MIRNSVSENEILIEPTTRLLKAMESEEIPLTIFADTECLLRFRNLGMEEFPQQAEEQLKDCLRRGHDVQNHVHPHWRYALYDQKTRAWSYDENKFLLGNVGNSDLEIYSQTVKVLTETKKYLQSLLDPVDANYRCIAYRAGGYGIQPKDSLILKALETTGYTIDSSIAPGLVLKTKFNRVDFSNLPHLANYFMKAQGGIHSSQPEGILEVPIAATSLLPFYYVKNIVRKLHRKVFAKSEAYEWLNRGGGLNTAEGYSANRWEVLKDRTKSLFQPWSYLNLGPDSTADSLFETAVSYYQRFRQPMVFSILCHSKTLSNSMIQEFLGFHRKMKQKFPSTYRAIRISEARSFLNLT